MAARPSAEKGYRPRVIVKLHPHVRFDAKSRVTGETLGLAAEGRGLTMRPLFAPKKAKIEELEKRATENDPTYRGAPQATGWSKYRTASTRRSSRGS